MYNFPLPRASQECYTKWFNQTITTGALKNRTIVWAARSLPCRFRSDTVKDIIGPQHVFILKLNDVFSYGLIDNTDTVYKLPKKYYTSCFPGIQYNQIPKNNLIKVKLNNDQTIELPYIPQSFLDQKRTKTNRKRRRSESESNQVESINFNEQTPEWNVLGVAAQKNDNKEDILHLIRSIIFYNDTNENFSLKNYFENVSVGDIKNNDTLREKLKIVVSFIYYYCRNELGFFKHRDPMSISDLQLWLSEACS
mgnify:CR=1 FL=1